MNMDFEKMFTFVTQDAKWKEKIGIGGTLSLLSLLVFIVPFLACPCDNAHLFLMFLLLACLTSLVLNFAVLGFATITANNRIHNKEQIMPEWSEFGKLVFAGFKTVMGHLVCFIPFTIITGILIAILGFGAFFPENFATAIMSLFLLIVGIIGLFIIYCLMMVFYFPLYCSFLTDMKVLSFVNYKSAFALLKNNIINYLLFWLLLIAISLILQTVAILLCCTLVGILALPWVLFYSYIVCAELMAQFVHTKKE